MKVNQKKDIVFERSLCKDYTNFHEIVNCNCGIWNAKQLSARQNC